MSLEIEHTENQVGVPQEASGEGQGTERETLCLKPDEALPDNTASAPRVVIDKAMQAVLPPLTPENRAILKSKIQAEGPTEPLHVMSKGRTLLDGYARFEIYNKLGIQDYPIAEVDLDSQAAGQLWRFRHNVSARRNLNTYQRIKAALEFEGYLRSEGRKHQQLGGKGMKVPADQKVDALQEIAQLAGVSRDTVAKVKRILANLDKALPKNRVEEMKGKLETGEKTINAALGNIIRAQDEKAGAKKSQGPSQKKKGKQKSFDNPKTFENQIIHGDSLDVLKKLPDNYASLFLFSPPYHGVDENYGGCGRVFKEYADYLDWLKSIFKECSRILRRGGRLCINIDSVKSRDNDDEEESFYRYPVYHDICKIAEDPEVDLLFFGDVAWEKQNCPGRKNAIGNPPHRFCFRRNHEYLIFFSKQTHTLENVTGQPHDLLEKEKSQWTMTTWAIAPETKIKDHPHAYPEELCERVIKLCTWPDDVVIDCFVGSGTTTAVAAKLNRKFVGIDANPDYCRSAKKRTEAALAEISKSKDSQAEAA